MAAAQHGGVKSEQERAPTGVGTILGSTSQTGGWGMAVRQCTPGAALPGDCEKSLFQLPKPSFLGSKNDAFLGVSTPRLGGVSPQFGGDFPVRAPRFAGFRGGIPPEIAKKRENSRKSRKSRKNAFFDDFGGVPPGG